MLEYCYMADISSAGRLRIAGDQALEFIKTMTTAEVAALHQLGGHIVSLILNGESGVIDQVTIIRTGDLEYMMVTSPATKDEVHDWLKAHAELTDEQGELFGDLTLTEESEALSATALFGPGSAAILDELSGHTLDEMPKTGSLSLLRLDTVTTLVFSPSSFQDEGFELFCPPETINGLNCALLSFPEVVLLDEEGYVGIRREMGSWFDADSSEYIYPDSAGLMHLVRPSMDFVGGSALTRRLADCQTTI